MKGKSLCVFLISLVSLELFAASCGTAASTYDDNDFSAGDKDDGRI